MRTYFKRSPGADYEWYDTPNLESTSRHVIETEEVIDTGIIDEDGNKIMAKERKEPIGFIRFR